MRGRIASTLSRTWAAAILPVLLSAGIYSQDAGFNRTSMTIVVFGDSTTAPRNVDGKPLAVTASILGDRLRGEGGAPKVINAGDSGNTTGYLYEAFSRDGIHWGEPRPSPFYTSTGPAGLLRVPDGKILVFWNNCELPPRLDAVGVYGGRDALHAAVSEDEGRTCETWT